VLYTRERLAQDLRVLGVQGGVLFLHASFKALGVVEGGAASVVEALEDAVGGEGLILMPSFNLVERERRAETWGPASTPSTVGWLTEFFRRMPGTVRSDHYSHSVAARGKGAAAFVQGHRSREGWRSPWDMESWGRTYGTASPMVRAYEADGQLLMLGVDYASSTYVHLVEVISWNRALARDPAARFVSFDRPALGAFWDACGALRRGRVGDAECRLFPIRAYVDTLVEETQRDPQRYTRRPRS
jgi:aminoglycoside 3-N-acetyltransferase